MEKEDIISVQWAQEDVETSYNLLNNNNIYDISRLRVKPQRTLYSLYSLNSANSKMFRSIRAIVIEVNVVIMGGIKGFKCDSIERKRDLWLELPVVVRLQIKQTKQQTIKH